MSKTRKPKSALREWVESILIALVLAVLIRSYFIQPFKIPSGSMRMTLIEGDHLFVDKWTYGPQVLPPMFWDIGFQLSFAATVGIMYGPRVIARYLKNIPECWGLRDTLFTTTCAIISTLPLTLYYFRQFSVVAPIVNLLVLWLIPWIMIAGFVIIILSFLFFPFAQALALFPFVGMEFIVRVCEWFAAFYFATL